MRDDMKGRPPFETRRSRHSSLACRIVAAAAATILLTGGSAVGRAGPQVFKTPGGRAENVRVERSPGEVVAISYDLASDDAQAVFTVVLLVSRDGGKTFDLRPKSVAGDVGSGVRVGRGKKIVWQAGRDVESVEMDSFRFSIRTEAAAAKPVSAPPATAAPTPPAPKSAPASAAPPEKEKKGSPMKWVLPLVGVGAAAGIAVAAKGGGGSSSSGGSSTTTPPVVYPDSVTIGAVSPAPGSTITATGTPPNATLPIGSGLMSVSLTLSSSQNVQNAYAFVFLLDNNQTLTYCAYNGGYDVPTWRPLPAGQVTATITGFRVFKTPCTVTALRAVLYRDGSDTPIAETTRVVTYQIK
jgi:hypothetical protein